MKLIRYRVRPAGNTDEDAELEIESLDAPSAASALARILAVEADGSRRSHRDRRIQVRHGSRWVTYLCRHTKFVIHKYTAEPLPELRKTQ